MNLSKDTIEVLKNFSSINQNMKFCIGTKLRTVSEAGNILAEATIDTKIPANFCLHEISQFLGAYKLFDEPDLEFGPKSVTFKSKDGSNKIELVYAAEAAIVFPPEKVFKFPDPSIKFDLTEQDIRKIEKAASFMKLSDLSFVSESGKVMIIATNRKVKSSSRYAIDTGIKTDAKFNYDTSISVLNLLPGDYTVSLTLEGKRKVAFFEHKSFPVKYTVAGDSTSKYSD